VAALEQAPGLRTRPSLPRELRYASRGHDRRDSRTGRGLYQGCPRHVRHATLPPERGAARIRTPTTGVTLALSVTALELPQYIELVPYRPERRPGTHSCHAGVIRALSVVPLRLPSKGRIWFEPSRGKARPAFGTTTGAVPSSCSCSGVTSEEQDPHVASRGKLVSNPTTMGGTSSGRRCCFPGVAPRAVSLCRSPRRACRSVHTPARPVVFTDRRPAPSW